MAWPGSGGRRRKSRSIAREPWARCSGKALGFPLWDGPIHTNPSVNPRAERTQGGSQPPTVQEPRLCL